MIQGSGVTKKFDKYKKFPTRKFKPKNRRAKHDNIDVKTLEDVAKLTELIKNNVVTLLLIYADWCGHCTTFKNDIWKDLLSTKNRKIPMAQVNETVLEHVKKLIPGFKVDGFPTAALVGKDMKVAMNKDPESGQITSSIPNSRHLPTMQRIVTSDPKKIVKMNELNSAGEDELSTESGDVSATPTPEANELRNENANNTLENLDAGTPLDNVNNDVNPPSVEDDIIKVHSQKLQKAPLKQPKIGGSLYESLLEMTKEKEVEHHKSATRRSKPHRKGTKRS
jgi:thiol-disulfide isomerase/thioredoxin